MKKTNNKSAKRKLIPAIAMLTCSAVMLSTATYAWFTMNKEVKVTGMEVKAHAEEGLLINEVKTADDANWDEEAKAGDSEYLALRPASSADLATWWHANSLKFDNEAGYGTNGVDAEKTAKIGSSDYYSDIKPASVKTNTRTATAGSVAERAVYFNDASFGATADELDAGEGYYVMYKYYIKSSSPDGMSVDKDKFMVTANAVIKDGETATDLDKALRVGVKIGDDKLIFAPTGGQTSYHVTKNTAGSSYDDVTAYNAETAIGSTGTLSIPKVTEAGMEVDVYVWFEGEDKDCMSKNLNETLNDYKIDLKFRIADLVG